VAETAITFVSPATASLTTEAGCDVRPAVGEVHGRTLVSLVSTGTEINWGYLGSTFPTTTGYAAVFEVTEVGAEVHHVGPGDRAFVMGPHRSYQRAQAEAVIPIPPGLPPEHAVFCRLMGVTMSTLTTTQARPPERVLVTGLGPVGHLGARIFDSCGYVVTACDPSAQRRSIALANGVADVRESVPAGDPAIAGHVALALECSGHDGATLEACKVVRRGGEVVLVGVPWSRRTDASAHELLHAVFHRYAVVRSGWEWEIPLHAEDFRHNSIYGNIAAAVQWLASGRIDVAGLYQTARPDAAAEVYASLHRGDWPALTAVFDWHGGA
jgi:threonine dehydrogenase-like Zn-dependent dehydrogenase